MLPDAQQMQRYKLVILERMQQDLDRYITIVLSVFTYASAVYLAGYLKLLWTPATLIPDFVVISLMVSAMVLVSMISALALATLVDGYFSRQIETVSALLLPEGR